MLSKDIDRGYSLPPKTIENDFANKGGSITDKKTLHLTICSQKHVWEIILTHLPISLNFKKAFHDTLLAVSAPTMRL
jgi:hypothetical protein